MKRCLCLALCLGSAAAQAETAVCHVDYGGEVRRIVAGPTESPLAVPTVAVGSYFRFRVVFEARTAIKTYVYAERDAGPPLPLHQGVYAWPPVAGTHFGFTGLHYVYEPELEGELAYWCELKP